MGYKSNITSWKKIQDWVLELLEGLGVGTAYKYDKASDTATVKAGTIKNESGSFAWINSLGQWIINLGTNAAETWGILGNYRFGQDSNGHGTWNGIFQRDGNGNNHEVLHSDDGITQLKFKGEERVAASKYNTQLEQISKGNTSRRAVVQLGSSEVHIGTAPTNSDTVYNGIEISQYHGDTETVAFKYKGKYALMFIPSGSFSLGAVYKGIIYNAIRSGRDTLDKGFYTELLIANRAYQQIGVWETGGMSPTPPTPYTPSAGEYDYRLEYDALGNLIYSCIEGIQKSFYRSGNVATEINGHIIRFWRDVPQNVYADPALALEEVYSLAWEWVFYAAARFRSRATFEEQLHVAQHAFFNEGITVTKNVTANNIPELVLPDHRTPVDTVTIAHHSLSGTENLPGDGQFGGNCYSHSGEHSPGGKGYWSVGTGDPSGRGFWQNIPIPGNIEDYLDYEVIVTVWGTGDNHPLGIALCSNQGEATFGYARYVQTPSRDNFVDVNFGFVRDFQNRQNSMSIVINAESAQNRYDISDIRLEKRNHPEGNYTLTAQVTMVNDEPQITYAWVKQ